MKYLILAAAVLVTGCATTQGPTEVKIPVAVPCKAEEPNQPTYRFTPPYTNIFDASRDLVGDREVALAYENALRTALRSCK
jgi:hypothetical protein